VGALTYLLILLPVVITFFVLYYIDASLERRVNHSGLAAVLEIFIALMLLIFGFGFALSILL